MALEEGMMVFGEHAWEADVSALVPMLAGEKGHKGPEAKFDSNKGERIDIRLLEWVSKFG